jgi:hypothetical protein
MSGNEPKRRLVGPWQSLHVVIWAIGIYILIQRGSFFPGILVLVAISALYEAFLHRYVPEAYVEEPSADQTSADPPPTQPLQPRAPDLPVSSPVLEHPVDRLPNVCPNCGGPILGHAVKWTGSQSASCPYCGTHLILEKS